MFSTCGVGQALTSRSDLQVCARHAQVRHHALLLIGGETLRRQRQWQRVRRRRWLQHLLGDHEGVLAEAGGRAEGVGVGGGGRAGGLRHPLCHLLHGARCRLHGTGVPLRQRAQVGGRG